MMMNKGICYKNKKFILYYSIISEMDVDSGVVEMLYYIIYRTLEGRDVKIKHNVTKLIEKEAFRWPKCCEEKTKKERICCLRYSLENGREGYHVKDFYEGGYPCACFECEKCYLDREVGEIRDYANLQGIYFLLVPKYKRILKKKIEKEIMYSTIQMHRGISQLRSLQNISATNLKYNLDTIFCTFRTITKDEYFGRKLMFFEEYLLKKTDICRYLYSGRFPLQLLGIIRDNLSIADVDCTIFVEEDFVIDEVLKSIYIFRLDTNRMLMETYPLIMSSIYKRYVSMTVRSEIGHLFGGEHREEYCFDVIVVSNLDDVYNMIMREENSIYETNICKTIAWGPITRLEGDTVGIKVTNYDLHVRKQDIIIPSEESLYKQFNKEKVVGINNFYREYIRKYLPRSLPTEM